MGPPPVQYVTTRDGYNIAYTVEGSGPALVNLSVLSHRTLRRQQDPVSRANHPVLTSRFRVIGYDKRGTGMSTRGLSPDHTYADYQMDLEAVVDHLQLQRFILQDQGLMAQVAVDYALAHSERVEALVLVGPRLGPRPRFEGHLSHMEQDWDYFLDSLARNNLVPGEDPVALKEYFNQTVTQADHIKWFRSSRGQNLEPLLGRIGVPTLVLTVPREVSNNFDPEGTRRVAAMIPGARLQVVEHFRDFARHVVEFADELAPVQTQTERAQATALSPRELDVLLLLASGKSNPEIADALAISRNTVLRHVNHIFAKTGAANRVQATSYAHREGLV